MILFTLLKKNESHYLIREKMTVPFINGKHPMINQKRSSQMHQKRSRHEIHLYALDNDVSITTIRLLKLDNYYVKT